MRRKSKSAQQEALGVHMSGDERCSHRFCVAAREMPLGRRFQVTHVTPQQVGAEVARLASESEWQG